MIHIPTRSGGSGMPDPYEWWGNLIDGYYLNSKNLFNKLLLLIWWWVSTFVIKYHFNIVFFLLCREQPWPFRRNYLRNWFNLLAPGPYYSFSKITSDPSPSNLNWLHLPVGWSTYQPAPADGACLIPTNGGFREQPCPFRRIRFRISFHPLAPGPLLAIFLK